MASVSGVSLESRLIKILIGLEANQECVWVDDARCNRFLLYHVSGSLFENSENTPPPEAGKETKIILSFFCRT